MSPTPERVSNPQNAYGMSKLGQEMFAVNLGRRYGIPTVALRYSIVQGTSAVRLQRLLGRLSHLLPELSPGPSPGAL